MKLASIARVTESSVTNSLAPETPPRPAPASWLSPGLLFLGDVAALAAATGAAHLVPPGTETYRWGTHTGLVLALCLMGGLYHDRRLHTVAELRSTVLAAGFATLLTGCVEWAMVGPPPLLHLTVLGIASVMLLPTVRRVVRLTSSFTGRRTVLLERRESTDRLTHLKRRATKSGLSAVAVHTDASTLPPGTDVVGLPSQLAPDILRSPPASTLFLDIETPALAQVWSLDGLERLRWRHDTWTARTLKRTSDLLLCVLSGVVVVPLGIALTLAIKLTSRGPAFFGHERIGRNGRIIKVWKFRSMVVDADQRLESYLADHPELRDEWDRTHKLVNDPRITGVGRLLRKTSIDELPQWWNVLRGDMSWVGPRPIVRAEISKYGAYFEDYVQVRPGLTGLWQISGRNATTYHKRVRLDAAYVQKWSPWLDASILLSTPRCILSREGAS